MDDIYDKCELLVKIFISVVIVGVYILSFYMVWYFYIYILTPYYYILLLRWYREEHSIINYAQRTWTSK
jgi:hypothetical protein